MLDKYADDTVLTGLITHDDFSNYTKEIEMFVNWCNTNYLILNVDKTKEMIFDFRRNITEPDPVTIDGKEVDRVEAFKYLGVTIDNKLSWSPNTDALIKKSKPRLYCLRILKHFNINTNLLQLFFNSIVMSALSFGQVCWGGNTTQQDRDRLQRIVKVASKIIGENQDDVITLCERQTLGRMKNIISDPEHPMYLDYRLLKIDRSGRYRIPKAKTERFLNSFFTKIHKTF